MFKSSAETLRHLLFFFTRYTDSRLNGDLRQSGVKFIKPPNLAQMNLVLNGANLGNFQSFACEHLDTGAINYMYLQLFSTLQSYYTNDPPFIPFETFLENCFIYAADLTAANMVPTEGTLPLNRTGSNYLLLKCVILTHQITYLNTLLAGDLRMRIEFKEASESYKLLIYGLKPCLLEIRGTSKSGRTCTLSKWQ